MGKVKETMMDMNDFTIDELIQAEIYAEWKVVMGVTAEHEALLHRPCERREIAPITEVVNSEVIAQRLEIYLLKSNETEYEQVNVPLYAINVKQGTAGFFLTLQTNYMVVREIVKRLGNEELLTYEEYEAITMKQLAESMEK